MQWGVGVVDLCLVSRADGTTVLVEEDHVLGHGVDVLTGRASWLTAAEKSHGTRSAAGTSRRRTTWCEVALQQRVGEELVPQPETSCPAVVGLGPAGRQALHGDARLGEAEGDALAGEGIDVAAGVADEQHPARRRATSRAAAAARRPSPWSGHR